MEELAKRAVACKHWRWMPGMLVHNADGPVRIDGGDSEPFIYGRCQWSGERFELSVRSGPHPDLTDPATLGCLLALVREAWNDPGIACVTSSYSNGQYYRRVVDGHHHGSTFQTLSQATHLTEAEALITALEAAP